MVAYLRTGPKHGPLCPWLLSRVLQPCTQVRIPYDQRKDRRPESRGINNACQERRRNDGEGSHGSGQSNTNHGIKISKVRNAVDNMTMVRLTRVVLYTKASARQVVGAVSCDGRELGVAVCGVVERPIGGGCLASRSASPIVPCFMLRVLLT